MTRTLKQFAALAIMVLLVGSTFAQGKKDLISANNALGQGDYDKAFELIDKAFEDAEMNSNPKAFLYKGKIYTLALTDTAVTEKPANAIEIAKSSLSKAEELDVKGKYADEINKHIESLTIYTYNEGVASIRADNLPKAYEAFSNTIVFNKILADKGLIPLDTNAMYWKGVSAYSIGKKEEGVSMLNNVLEMGYGKTYVYQKLIEFAKIDESDNLISIIDAAKAAYPDEPYFKIEELNYYLNRGEGSKVLDKMKDAVAAEPQNLSLQIALASVYDSMGNLEAAQETYDGVLAKDENNFDALYSLGTMFFNKGKGLNDAMNELDFDQQAKYNELKTERDDLFKKARPYFQQAAVVEPSDQNTQLALRQIALIIGE